MNALSGVFYLQEERVREEIADLRIIPVTVDDDADTLHAILIAASEPDDGSPPVIHRSREFASLAVYPLSMAEPDPTLAVNPGVGGPTLLGHGCPPIREPDLSPVDATVSWLRECVNQANALISNNEEHRVERPVLNHVYDGVGVRLSNRQDDPAPVSGHVEQIEGAFRVLCWLPTGGAIVGNGEKPEDIWATATAPERAA